MKHVVAFAVTLVMVVSSFIVTVEANSISPSSDHRAHVGSSSHKNKPKPYKYNVFYKMHNGKVVYFEMLRKKDGRRRLMMYPYGKAAARHGVPRPIISAKKFLVKIKALAKKEEAARKRSGLPKPKRGNVIDAKSFVSSASTPLTTGLGMGLNPSTGYIGPESVCYNATTSWSSLGSVESLSSAQTASSFAEQYGASSSISGSYDGFSASNNFTFQESYENSGNAGQIYYNAYSLYQLTNTLNTSNPFNSYGQNAQQAGTFTSDCGSSFVNAMTAGILITSQFYWSSSSSSTSESINDQVTGSYTTLASTTDAISWAYQQTDSSTSFGFIDVAYGGGAQASATLSQATSSSTVSQEESSCLESGNSSDCTAFFTAIQDAVNQAIADFNAAMPSNGDYSAFEVFPYGVAGSTTYLGTQNIYSEPLNNLISSSTTYSDALEPYAAQLNNYVNVLNQVSSLNQRAAFVNGLVSQSYFNPTYYLNISYYTLSPLINAYSSDYQTLTNNLGSCLNYSSSSSGSVQDSCSAVLNLYSSGITDAYQYYAAGGPSSQANSSNQVLVQQNTIALQYTGINQTSNLYASGGTDFSCCNSTVPTDLVWTQVVNSTPTYPYSTSALIAFGDQVYPTVGSGGWTTSNAAFTQIISTNNSAPQNTMSIPVSGYQTNDCLVTYSATGHLACSSPMTFTYANGCTSPTFSNPCGITGFIQFPTAPGTTTLTQSLNLYPIPNFFVQ